MTLRRHMVSLVVQSHDKLNLALIFDRSTLSLAPWLQIRFSFSSRRRTQDLMHRAYAAGSTYLQTSVKNSSFSQFGVNHSRARSSLLSLRPNEIVPRKMWVSLEGFKKFNGKTLLTSDLIKAGFKDTRQKAGDLVAAAASKHLSNFLQNRVLPMGDGGRAQVPATERARLRAPPAVHGMRNTSITASPRVTTRMVPTRLPLASTNVRTM